jgi:hypothetical protein
MGFSRKKVVTPTSISQRAVSRWASLGFETMQAGE